MVQSRKEIIEKNIYYGLLSQIVLTLLPFINRTIFLKYLGVDYLGISSLFTSILSMLSLAELGIGNVVIYSLYKPLAESNFKKIKVLIDFYKQVYRFIIVIISFAGLIIFPFLDKIINLPNNIPYIKFYFILFLLNTIFSYVNIYKISIIRAAQKQYIISYYTTLFTIIMHVFQILILILFKNYFFYLSVQLVTTLILNTTLSLKAEKEFPFLDKSIDVSLSKIEKENIFNDTFSMMKYKVGGVLLNSTDNIYISILVGTVQVGLFNNYLSLQMILNRIVVMLQEAVNSTVGHINVSESLEFQYKSFIKLCFYFIGFATVTSVGYLCLSDDVISIWLGEKYLIQSNIVFALTINYFLPVVLQPVWIFRNSTGLFNKTKNILLYAAFFNLILSFFLGKSFGLVGIIISTSISRLMTSVWYEPLYLYKEYFPNYNILDYFLLIIKSILTVVTSFIIIDFIQSFITSFFFKVTLKFILSLTIPTLIYIFLNFSYAKRIFKKLLH